MNRDVNKELEEIGGAIGKYYINSSQNLCMCIGDLRYAFPDTYKPYLVVSTVDGINLCNNVHAVSLSYFLCVSNGPKATVKRAKAIILAEESIIPVDTDAYFKDEEELRKIYDHISIKILKFPHGEWIECDE